MPNILGREYDEYGNPIDTDPLGISRDTGGVYEQRGNLPIFGLSGKIPNQPPEQPTGMPEKETKWYNTLETNDGTTKPSNVRTIPKSRKETEKWIWDENGNPVVTPMTQEELNAPVISGVGSRMMIQDPTIPKQPPIDEFGNPVSRETQQRILANLGTDPISEEDKKYLGVREPSEDQLTEAEKLEKYKESLLKNEYKDVDLNDPAIQKELRGALLHGREQIQKETAERKKIDAAWKNNSF